MKKKILIRIFMAAVSAVIIAGIYLLILHTSNNVHEEQISDVTSMTQSDFYNTKSTLVNDSTIEGLREYCDSNNIVVKDWHTWYTSIDHDPVVAYQYIQSEHYDILVICGRTVWLVKIEEELYEEEDGQIDSDYSWKYSDPVTFR